MNKTSHLSTSLILCAIAATCSTAHSQTMDIQNPIKIKSKFQKIDASLLSDFFRTNKQTNKSKESNGPEPILMTPKEIRIAIVRDNINKMLLKNSTSNSITAGTIGAVITAQPAGLLLGGIIGALQGKSKRYEEAQGKLDRMERDIIASGDYDLTAEEIRLAGITGTNIFKFLSLASVPITIVVNDGKNKPPAPSPAPAPITSSPTDCYGSSSEQSLPSYSERQSLVLKCFYNMD